MVSVAAPHRSPRQPRAWAWWFAASQAAVIALWWRFGWAAGLPAMLLSHGAVVWGTLWPRSRLFGPVLSHWPTAREEVWLTIDDGPSGDTRAMLDLLDEYAAQATFFLVGARVREQPELVRELLRRGHGIGNHSDGHPSAWFWALPPAAIEREIARAQAALDEVAGQRPRWFRAVVGMANPFVAATLKRHGLARVAWSARGFDAVQADPEKVWARIERDLRPGAIVLMHEGARHGRSVEALRTVLQGLKARGYRAVLPENA